MSKLISADTQPALVGLVQSVFGIFLMLMLVVFSAAVTGSLVFAYPVYLVLNKKIKESMQVLVYNLVFTLIIIFTTVVVLFSIV